MLDCFALRRDKIHNPFMILFSQIFAQNKNISINGMLSLTFNEDLMQFGLSMNISEFLRGKHKKNFSSWHFSHLFWTKLRNYQ